MSASIIVRGAREHNLKNISVEIPRDKLVVITGLSGSGKSSLAFDTIYAEGQRRYVESLSSYARQFLGQIEKPDVDSIEGLSPAISIEQKTTHRNPRSTVGTVTEIYDYLRLAFARVGEPHCPNGHGPMQALPIDVMVAKVFEIGQTREKAEKFRLHIMAPIAQSKKGEFKDIFARLLKDGFTRIRVDGTIYELEDAPDLEKNKKHTIDLITDRLAWQIGKEEEIRSRLAESIELALSKGENLARIETEFLDANGNSLGKEEEIFSAALSCSVCGFSFPAITHRLFSFNSPDGACPHCSGLGYHLEFHPDLLIPDPEKSVREGVVTSGLGWTADSTWYQMMMSELSKAHKFSLDKPWNKLPEKIQNIILNGDENVRLKFEFQNEDSNYSFTRKYEGIIPNLHRRYRSTNSDSIRQRLEQYMVQMECNVCHGARLKPEPLSVFIAGKNIDAITRMSIEEAFDFFSHLKLEKTQATIAEGILKEIKSRLSFLMNVGVGYLNLNRTAGTLSGGEAQRIRLATQIGSALVGVLYVLDEPSIGLHQSDNEKLIHTLRNLRDLGNTVIVVEHDEETIESGDFIIDMGPGAGVHGGEIVFAGGKKELLKAKNSLTADYINGKREIPIPEKRREGNGKKFVIRGAAENNLKNIDVEFPAGKFICVTGLSGSGKSTLVNEILYKIFKKKLFGSHILPGKHKSHEGADIFDKVINIDQSPIGRTPRSNPATYTGAFTPIRDLFAQLPASKMRGYKPGRFSFNVAGGRCEACEGDGVKKIEMHFLPDVYVTCEVCKGRRYNMETLEVKYKGKNIYDVLEMSVEEANDFFSAIPAIAGKMGALKEVGLSYIKLGQPATTLSGGEAQRVKLATELSRRSTGKTLYILDEPTTGLHFEDIRQLLLVLHTFVEQGNTVLVIEHNMDVIKTADWILDLGPEGGAKGGEIVFAGTPEDLVRSENSLTGKYLKKWLKI